MTRDVVSLRTSGAAVLPFAGQAKVVGALTTDMIVAQMIIQGFCIRKELCALDPLARQGRVVGGSRRGWSRRRGAGLGTLGVGGINSGWHAVGEEGVVDKSGAVFQAFQGHKIWHPLMGRTNSGWLGSCDNPGSSWQFVP